MSILGSATSGLLAFQRALATTSQNISNASTEGYSRQRTEFSARNPQMLGGNYIGQGVQISSVRRLQSDLVNAQLRTSLSNNAYGETLASYAESIDSLLGDSSTGLAPSLESFFASVQDVSSDPTSISARTVMLDEAASLSERFATINTRLDEQRTLVNGKIGNVVDEINQYAKSLADLNRQIVSDSSGGGTPNDLLDQRDTLLNKIAERIDINIAAQDDGSVSVFVGNGQALVMGGTTNTLVAEHLAGDPVNVQIGLKTTSNAPVDVTRFMTGGELGALLETRTGLIDSAQNTLGLISLNLGTAVNAQNALGLDLNGNLGGAIFEMPEVSVNPDTASATLGSPTVTIEDVTALSASDYRLRYDGTGYEVIRLPGSTAEALTPPDPLLPNELFVDGLKIDTSSLTGAPTSGDSWLIQPTRYASGKLNVVMTDPKEIAAAGAMTASVVDTNRGAATISSVTAVDSADAALFDDAVVEFDGTNYTVTTSSGTVTVTPTVDSTTNTTTISANGWELKLKGTPATGDQFTVGKNPSIVGDNRNSLAMTAIQGEQLVEGVSTIQGTYTGIVADVGTQTRQAQITRDASATLLESAQAQREAISGVNLDEEAADLVRYQQAYQACAQVISVTSTVFDTLINAVQR